MDVRIGTTPVACLPFRLAVGRRRELVLLPSPHTNAIILNDEEQDHTSELGDIILDIVWCCNLDEEVIVIGSEEGDHVYVIDTSNLKATQDITVLHYEDYSWRKFAILSTPDGKHVAVVSELMFVIMTWAGKIVTQRRILMSDWLQSLGNTSITFLDTSAEGTITYTFPDSCHALETTVSP